MAQVEATVTGLPRRSGRLRVDAVGLPGTIHVVVVKSDAASLGVHGIAVQRLDGSGAEPWNRLTFEATNATETRHAVMSLLGREIRQVIDHGHGPVHVVVPDKPTADLLVSIADSLAGVELSRLRWQRDLDEGRDLLTFDGEPATMPDSLGEDARTAVSLLLEEDRSRAEIEAMGFDPATVERVVRLVDLAEYKRRQTAPGVRISTKAFGKDCRLPITSRYRG